VHKTGQTTNEEVTFKGVNSVHSPLKLLSAFSRPCQARLTDAGRRCMIFSTCPFICPSVHLFVRLAPNLQTWYFENEWAYTPVFVSFENHTFLKVTSATSICSAIFALSLEQYTVRYGRVSHPTRHMIGHFGDDFTGQMTQPTVS